nr:MFS transporter [Kibdelosporangium sp. MJ126-NF4]CEL13103.1 Drug resistance transporter EmrB/QacA subfamily [Kibdelosporangium sp. MJ126-NF4]
MIQVRHAHPGRRSPANRWWVVGGMGLAVFMASLDLSIVNLSLPAIRDTLGASTATTQWVVLGYLLPLVALALPTGRWLDGIDHRDALICACAGFGIASLAAGVASSIGWLIAARVVQGLFGTVVMALVPVLITTSVDARVRGRAMGLVDAFGMLGLISGPAVGGLFVATVGWPWIFYINVPACAALIVLAFVQVPRRGRIRGPGRGSAVESVLLTGAVGGVMVAFTLATGPDPQWLAVGLVALPLLLVWHRLPLSEPVRRLLTQRRLRAPLGALTGTAVATGVLLYIVPFYLITLLRTPSPVAGLTMLTFPVAAAVLGPLAGLLADRYGDRRIALVGVIVLISGLLVLVPANRSWQAADVAWRLAIAGAGIGLFNAPNMSAAMSASPVRLLATTGATTSVARQAGFALGPAVATLVWGLSGYTVGGIRNTFAVASVLVAASAIPLARGVRTRHGESERP